MALNLIPGTFFFQAPLPGTILNLHTWDDPRPITSDGPKPDTWYVFFILLLGMTLNLDTWDDPKSNTWDDPKPDTWDVYLSNPAAGMSLNRDTWKDPRPNTWEDPTFDTRYRPKLHTRDVFFLKLAARDNPKPPYLGRP